MILYEYENGLYVNLTNRCTCACTFCIRLGHDGVGSADSLCLSRDPSEQEVLEALAEGKSVILYTPGLPTAHHNRAMAASLAARQRELKSWGVVFTDGGRKRLVTAQEARNLMATGGRPGPGAVLTPLAREILEGKQ